MTSEEYRHIVRIVGNDIHGEKKVLAGLASIKGIGHNFAVALLDSLKIDTNTNIGYLTDSQVKSIENIVSDPSSANFPRWFLNRRKDIETGKDLHILTSDLDFTKRNDIERERTTNSWRGIRHLFGLKVRGQSTRTTGRKGGTVGVAKGGKVQPGAPAAPAAPGGPGGPAAPAAPAAPDAATGGGKAEEKKPEQKEKKEEAATGGGKKE